MKNEEVSLLNELIELNNDRVAGYEKAIEEINEENVDLKALFFKKFSAK